MYPVALTVSALRYLGSAGTNRLLVPPVRLSSVGFHGCWTPCLEHSAGGHNNISVTQSAFCRHLRTWLFRKSYPDIII